MNHKPNIYRYFLFLIIIVSLLGCSSAPIKMNEIPTKPVDFANGREIRGKACGFQLLLLIPISINGRQEQAYAQLVSEAKGDYITDIEIEDSWFYGFVGTGYCTEIKAKAYPYLSKKE